MGWPFSPRRSSQQSTGVPQAGSLAADLSRLRSEQRRRSVEDVTDAIREQFTARDATLRRHEQAKALAECLNMPQPETPAAVRRRQSITERREARRNSIIQEAEEPVPPPGRRRSFSDATEDESAPPARAHRRSSFSQSPPRRGSIGADEDARAAAAATAAALSSTQLHPPEPPHQRIHFPETAEGDKEVDALVSGEMQEMGVHTPGTVRKFGDGPGEGGAEDNDGLGETPEDLVLDELRAVGFDGTPSKRRR